MEAPREPHSLSLKVLRLSRPSLSQQFPLPKQNTESVPQINTRVALDTASDDLDDQFILCPVLTLPPAFGTAYVGETFACTLCANNELSADAGRVTTSVKIVAEMQTPSQTVPLDLTPSDADTDQPQIRPGDSVQKIVHFDLREEGNHVLAVSLSYYETIISKENSASSGRVRTFRKLYQFLAQPCLSVRTKVSELPSKQANSIKPKVSKAQRFALEAQLENMADGPIVLEQVTFISKPPFESTSVNWDVARPDGKHVNSPILVPREVTQVAFLIVEQQDGLADQPKKEVMKDGRTVLGQLSIQWRTSMGSSGLLTTGWLMTKKR